MTVEKLGDIIRLQVQIDRVGERGVGYHADRIVSVSEGALSDQGMLGRHRDTWVVDVHHRGHPRFSGGVRRLLSVGFTGHYALMRDRFGATVTDGVAGENVIVGLDRRVTEDELAGGLVIKAADGDVVVEGLRVAAPCLEFTSHLLGRSEVGSAEEVADDRAFLHGGTRGFVAGLAGLDRPVVIRAGDEVWVL